MADEDDEELKFWTAGIYETWLASGGPEEGGWWYDVGNPSEVPEHVRALRVFTETSAASEYIREVLWPMADASNAAERRRPKESVLSTGVYEAKVMAGWPRPFPDVRPHYE